MNPHIAGDRKTLCELYEIELLNEGQNNKRLYVDNCTINGQFGHSFETLMLGSICYVTV